MELLAQLRNKLARHWSVLENNRGILDIGLMNTTKHSTHSKQKNDQKNERKLRKAMAEINGGNVTAVVAISHALLRSIHGRNVNESAAIFFSLSLSTFHQFFGFSFFVFVCSWKCNNQWKMDAQITLLGDFCRLFSRNFHLSKPLRPPPPRWRKNGNRNESPRRNRV